VVRLVRETLNDARSAALAGSSIPSADMIAVEVLERARTAWSVWPERLVNATGVVLHTNLGRAPLSRAALAAAMDAAGGYSNLEFDLNTGKRGSRQARIGELLSDVTGGQGGIAVNNNASAVLLVLSAMAAGREVIVSRGEAVEIGGGFRVPDVMRQSGAELVEVGTTNRTYVRDYEAAITERTAAILKVHPSNFHVSGFTHTADLAELVTLAESRGIAVLHDLGSGCLLNTELYGIAHEPTVQESVDAGTHMTMFSGDKLLGGPQAGLIVGAADHVRRVAAHPMARAVRMDKIGLAALGATLISYIRGNAENELPIWQAISMPLSDIDDRAKRWRAAVGAGEVVDVRSAIGGGSLPGQTLPSRALALAPQRGPDEFMERLRGAKRPVIARIEDGRVLLDPRTVAEHEDEYVIAALRSA
jgi:L-seryl-tRNA(Ser) seleniumtransferase